MITDNIVADSYLVADLRRYIADDISAGLFILFDVDSEPDDHSEVLLLFVGCIVNFIVSYLICMFQDSVPAGSYNDPFLSSVCVWNVCRDVKLPCLYWLCSLGLLLFFKHAEDFSNKHGATGSLHGCRQRSSMQLTRIWSLINSTCLQIILFSEMATG